MIVSLTICVLITSDKAIATEIDDRIEESAKKTYIFLTYLKGEDIRILSKEGHVVLTGTVSDGSNKLLANETVTSLPGVKSVENRLMINTKEPEKQSDAGIIANIKVTLLLHRNMNPNGTTISSDNGLITLHGTASSEAQKDLTTEYVKDVEGVNHVNNEMTVKATEAKLSETSMSDKIEAIADAIDDASITALVRVTLLYHRSTSAFNTNVETKDGQVTLRGIASNAAGKDLATKIASDVHGVKKVINIMTVDDAHTKIG